MPLDYQKLKHWKLEGLTHRFTVNDTILYALGVGLGHDPVDEDQLRFVCEKQLRALPTMATVLACPWGWLYEAGAHVTKVKAVHGEQGIRIHKALPVEGEVIGDTAVTHIVDKGKEKGAIVYSERKVYEKKTGDLLCTLGISTFCRADGGFGGPTGPVMQWQKIPDRAPDRYCDLATVPQAALIYRLTGDRNPLHSDPAVGRAAGFGRPILHGLCTFGVVGHALLKMYCNYDVTKLVAMNTRFSSPVYPGETIRTETWREGVVVLFQAKIMERDGIVVQSGHAEIAQ